MVTRGVAFKTYFCPSVGEKKGVGKRRCGRAFGSFFKKCNYLLRYNFFSLEGREGGIEGGGSSNICSSSRLNYSVSQFFFFSPLSSPLSFKL